MSDYQTFGLTLINDILPKEYQLHGIVGKKELVTVMARLAKDNPELYTKVMPAMKELGDKLATYDGISVGLDDIEPDYALRDPVLDAAKEKLKDAKTDDAKLEILLDTQDKISKLSRLHKGTLSRMVVSGGRGNANQLMKGITTPVLVADQRGRGVPILIDRSYAEGLSPAQYWIAGNEAIQNVISGQLATAEPGSQGKILINLASDQVISSHDCGTDNGVALPTKSGQVLDRYLAKDTVNYKRNTVVTHRVQSDLVAKLLERIIVRSPMTCEAREGVCQLCFGLDSSGKLPELGVNVGVRAAQAMSEPLTQLSLSAKHGLRLVKKNEGPKGLKAFVQYMESPKSFPNKATVATITGKISKIEEAPQGGFYVTVVDTQHYVPVGLDLKVKEGDAVEAGDALSEGTLYPPEVVQFKGIGAGRQYLIDKFSSDVLGGDFDRRHLELVMKKHLNHVTIDEDVGDNDFIPGDVVDYNAFKGVIGKSVRRAALTDDILGESLGNDVLHYTVGTRINSAIIRDLKSLGFKEVTVADKLPKFTPIVSPMSRVPLFNKDWIQKLNHRYIKDTLLDAAQFGEKSNVHGLNPIPAYTYGIEFGTGPGPNY